MKNLVYRIAGILCAAVFAQAAEVWEPPVSAAAVTPERTRIVKQGMDHVRDDDGAMFSISQLLYYRTTTNATTGLRNAQLASGRQKFLDYDVDGDGIVTNEMVSANPFSMQESMTPDGPWYDTTVGSQRMFGGAAIFTAGTTNAFGWSEYGLNNFEEGPYYQPRRNWTMFNEIYAFREGTRHSFIALNRSFTQSQEITLHLPYEPSSAYTEYLLTHENPRMTNRDGYNVKVVETPRTGFKRTFTFTLPPASACVLVNHKP